MVNKTDSKGAAMGVAMVLLSAFLFSAKAVLAKLVYREVTMSVIELLVLRMLYSMPFYLAMLLWQWRKYKSTPKPTRSASFFPMELLLPNIIVGCIGYYVSSFFDFWGLKYISAGLERIILFAYPTLVVIFGALFFRQKIYRYQVWALLLSYMGIAIAFVSDIKEQGNANVWLGGILIFTCAITFSFYVLISGKLIPKIGVGLFTTVGMLSATAGILLQFVLSGGSFEKVFSFAPHVQMLMVLMAVFTTVVPSFLVSAGIKRIGSSNVAIISSIGPMITIALAWYFLQEQFGWLQAFGTVLVVIGVIWVSRNASKA